MATATHVQNILNEYATFQNKTAGYSLSDLVNAITEEACSIKDKNGLPETSVSQSKSSILGLALAARNLLKAKPFIVEKMTELASRMVDGFIANNVSANQLDKEIYTEIYKFAHIAASAIEMLNDLGDTAQERFTNAPKKNAVTQLNSIILLSLARRIYEDQTTFSN